MRTRLVLLLGLTTGPTGARRGRTRSGTSAGRPRASPAAGPRVDPVSGAQGFHTGDDLQASYGTPIHAGRAGVVVIASAPGGYGNAVVIEAAA